MAKLVSPSGHYLVSDVSGDQLITPDTLLVVANTQHAQTTSPVVAEFTPNPAIVLVVANTQHIQTVSSVVLSKAIDWLVADFDVNKPDIDFTVGDLPLNMDFYGSSPNISITLRSV